MLCTPSQVSPRLIQTDALGVQVQPELITVDPTLINIGPNGIAASPVNINASPAFITVSPVVKVRPPSARARYRLLVMCGRLTRMPVHLLSSRDSLLRAAAVCGACCALSFAAAEFFTLHWLFSISCSTWKDALVAKQNAMMSHQQQPTGRHCQVYRACRAARQVVPNSNKPPTFAAGIAIKPNPDPPTETNQWGVVKAAPSPKLVPITGRK